MGRDACGGASGPSSAAPPSPPAEIAAGYLAPPATPLSGAAQDDPHPSTAESAPSPPLLLLCSPPLSRFSPRRFWPLLPLFFKCCPPSQVPPSPLLCFSIPSPTRCCPRQFLAVAPAAWTPTAVDPLPLLLGSARDGSGPVGDIQLGGDGGHPVRTRAGVDSKCGATCRGGRDLSTSVLVSDAYARPSPDPFL